MARQRAQAFCRRAGDEPDVETEVPRRGANVGNRLAHVTMARPRLRASAVSSCRALATMYRYAISAVIPGGMSMRKV
jgi:hypothetical protein